MNTSKTPSATEPRFIPFLLIPAALVAGTLLALFVYRDTPPPPPVTVSTNLDGSITVRVKP